LLPTKTVKAKVLELRHGKAIALEREYENFQRYLHGCRDVPLYSATKQQADRLLKRIKKPKPHREYPLILRNDVYRLDRTKCKLAEWWLRVPVYAMHGGIWIPIKPHTPITDKMKLREAKILRRNGDWFVYITVQEEIEAKQDCEGALAVDMGIHNVATTVNSKDPKPTFYGKKLRVVRGHYFYLRRKLPNRKAVKKVGSHEKRVVNQELHKISKAIVQEAKATNSVIVIGKLKGIRQNHRGRRGNRKLNSMPFHRLASYIRYKAEWQGVPVLTVSEAYTSQTCSRCGMRGLRVRGLFQCPSCGLDLNADWNGARNILRRGIGELKKQSMLEGSFDSARTSPWIA